MLRRSFVWCVAAWSVALLGCASFEAGWDRAMAHYHAARYPQAVRAYAELESEIPRQSEAMRARFYFYRGISNLRTGKRRDARHDLALADELASRDATALSEEERHELSTTLQRLDLAR